MSLVLIGCVALTFKWLIVQLAAINIRCLQANPITAKKQLQKLSHIILTQILKLKNLSQVDSSEGMII